MKLEFKFMLVCTAYAVLVSAVLFLFTRGAVTAAIETQIEERLNARGRAVMLSVDRLMHRHQQSVQNAAADGTITALLAQGGGRSAAQLESRLSEIATLGDSWAALALYDAGGEPLAKSGDENFVGRDAEEQERIAVRVALGGRVYVSDALRLGPLHKRTVVFAAPVYVSGAGAERRIGGALLGYLAWPLVTEVMHATGGPERAELLDATLVPLASSRGTFPVTGRDAVRAFARSEGYLSYESRGWTVSVEAARAAAAAPASRVALLLSLIIVALANAFIALLAIGFGRSFVRPVAAATSALGAVARGDTSVRLPTAGHDEIASLSGAFNAMAERLATYHQQLRTQRRVEAEARARYESLLNGMAEGVVMVDRAGVIISWNPESTRLTGWPPEEAVGSHFRKVIRLLGEREREDRSSMVENALGSRAIGQPEGHSLLLRRDGSEMLVTCAVTPVPGSVRGAAGAVLVCRDASSERNVEKAKDEFVSVASHQLRTPISAIRGLASELLEGHAGPLSPSQREYVDGIRKSNDRMVDLVGTLMHVSRIGIGPLAIRPVTVDLPAEIRAAAAGFAEEAKLGNVAMETTFTGSFDGAAFDVLLLRVAMRHLLANAVAYTKPGGKVTVTATADSRGISVEVADNGIGIPMGEQVRVFQRFFRSEAARKLRPGGSGLGLFIVWHVVTESGGTISFRSREGEGSAFVMSFPRNGMRERLNGIPLA